jgi:nitrogen fixation protein FixH
MRFSLVIIGIVCSLALAATIATIVIGIRTFEGTVVEKPYETGLQWDEIQKQRAQLGWNVTIGEGTFKTGKNELYVSVFDRDNRSVRNAELSILISRPSTRAYDRNYRAVSQGEGLYYASVDLPHMGAWDVTVNVNIGSNNCSFHKSIYAMQAIP